MNLTDKELWDAKDP